MSTTPSSCSNIRYVRRSCRSGGTSRRLLRAAPSARRLRLAATLRCAGSNKPSLPSSVSVGDSASTSTATTARGLTADGAAVANRPRRRGRSAAPASKVPERAANRVLDGALDRPAIAKAHLCLGRMHVDVDHVRGDDDVEEQRRPNAGGNRRSIRRLRRRERVPVSRIARPLTVRKTRRVAVPTSAGRSTSPDTCVVPLTSSTSSNAPRTRRRARAARRSRSAAAAGSVSIGFPSCIDREAHVAPRERHRPDHGRGSPATRTARRAGI